MPPRKDPLKEAFKGVQALRDEGKSDGAIVKLKSLLAKQNGMVVAKAAELAAEWFERTLLDDLIASFYRLSKKGAEIDPQCWGKTALTKALHELAWQDAAIYMQACRTFQFEPVWGGSEDTASALRIAAFQALTQLPVLDSSLVMTALADLLADSNKRVRAEAARLSVATANKLAAPLIRLKIRLGDEDTRVLGNCFDALLLLAPQADTAQLIHSFANASNTALEAEALASLASSSVSDAIHLVLERYEQQTDEQLKRILLTSLGVSTAQEATNFLLEKLTTDTNEATWALESLKSKLHDEDLKKQVLLILEERSNSDLLSALEYWRSS